MEEKFHKYIFASLIILFGVFLIYALNEFINAFLGAIVFYVLFKTPMYWLTHALRWNKTASALIIMFISFLLLIVPLFFFINSIYQKVNQLILDRAQIYLVIDSVTSYLNKVPINFSAVEITDKALTYITPHLGSVLLGSFGLLGTIFMMYFFLFFLLIYSIQMEGRLVHFLPFQKDKIILFGHELTEQTYSNALGIPLIGVVQGLFSYACFYFCNVPDAGLWAVLTGFSSIIPFVGTALIWGPITVYLFSIGNQIQAWAVIAFALVVLTNVDNVIRMILSKKIGDVHPMVTVLGVILGLQFFGFPGLVFGPLIISYFLLLLKLYYQTYYQTSEKIDPA